MSEYGKRVAPAAKGLSPEALERWRSRARDLLSHEHAVDEGDSHEESPLAVPLAPVASDATADTAHRRKTVRQKTLIGAKVVFNNMMSVFDCTVRDLSERGARLKLNGPAEVPPAFMLRFSDGRIRQCKVRRRNALELGIEFLD